MSLQACLVTYSGPKLHSPEWSELGGPFPVARHCLEGPHVGRTLGGRRCKDFLARADKDDAQDTPHAERARCTLQYATSLEAIAPHTGEETLGAEMERYEYRTAMRAL